MSHILTPEQVAALNAAGDVMAELPRFFLSSHGDGTFTAFGYLDGTYQSPTVHGCCRPTVTEAVQVFLKKMAEEQAKPQPLDAIGVRNAVVELADQHAGNHDAFVAAVKALPVKP